MSQRQVYIEWAKKIELKIAKEDSPRRIARFKIQLEEVRECIKNIENHGSPKKVDNIPIGCRIGT